MRVILSNGRQFIVKVRYTTDFKSTHTKDQFGRDVYTEWDEHNTSLSITEWFESVPTSKITVSGFAHCNYQDTFNKNVGKSLAYFRALDKLETAGVITPYEAEELASFKLDRPVFQCKKVEKSVKVGD